MTGQGDDTRPGLPARPSDGTDRPTTIYDVARVAGVSPSTVSRTFARPGRVSSRTAQRVRAVAEELGYRSEAVFRPLAPEKTRMIGLAVADITNPFFFPLIRGAERAAAEAGFTLLLSDAQESRQHEWEMLERALPVVDGMVISSSRMSDTDLRSVAKNVPVVVLNRHVTGLMSVITDTPRGVRRAVEHLAALGHRRICYVAGPEASWVDGARWRALREACLELELRECRVGPVAPTVAGGASAAAAVVAKGATSVLCYNDLVAIGVIRALQQRGVGVPDQVSVVGFDNIFAAPLITPALTTVASPQGSIGETAVRNVIALSRRAAGGGAGGRPDEARRPGLHRPRPGRSPQPVEHLPGVRNDDRPGVVR